MTLPFSPRQYHDTTTRAFTFAVAMLRSVRDTPDATPFRPDPVTVRAAQSVLAEWATMSLAKARAGFGTASDEVVIAATIVPDGIYGPKTFAALVAIRALVAEERFPTNIERYPRVLHTYLRTNRVWLEEWWECVAAGLAELGPRVAPSWVSTPSASASASASASTPNAVDNPPPQASAPTPSRTGGELPQTAENPPPAPPSSASSGSLPSTSGGQGRSAGSPRVVELPGSIITARVPQGPVQVSAKPYNPIWLIVGLGVAGFAGVLAWRWYRTRA